MVLFGSLEDISFLVYFITSFRSSFILLRRFLSCLVFYVVTPPVPSPLRRTWHRSHRAQLHESSDRVLVQSVLTDGVVDGGEVQVGGAWQGPLRCAAGRLLRGDEVVVQVEVVVAVGVRGGVAQRQDVSAAGRQRRLGGAQVGAGAAQCSGLPRQRRHDDGVTAEQRRGGNLKDELGALETLVLVTLRHSRQQSFIYTIITNSVLFISLQLTNNNG